MKKQNKLDKEETVVNKLFLIGNGFDLALDLKTRYTDFLFWLLKTEVLNALELFPRKVIAEGHTVYNEFMRQREPISTYGFSKNELFDVLVKENYQNLPETINKCDNLTVLIDKLEKLKIQINPINSNALFTKILKLSSVGWVDIEEIYFDMLKESLSKKNSQYLIDIINCDLDNISKKLKKYLNELEIDLELNKARPYIKQFCEEISEEDIILSKNQAISIKPNHIYFLNFNYTQSLNIILEQSGLEVENITINQIHSSADSNEDLIFGFGDEMDAFYKQIEELNDNRYFKFIKSFHYFKRNNYRQLLRFLNSDFFQVCIYGHSCGLSDRIMLNEIFEHEKCKSIKIYYHNDEDFTSKTMNISRHFNSNKLMREKIVNKNPNNKIPQVKSTN